ncbi:MAG TPA: hypothetical protein VGF16_07470 [Bryobacteraceae bacterium]|jgi:hypothetical protein
MDLQKTITELREWRDQLARIIAQLEELQTGDANPTVITAKRRGRKFMGAKERAEVSKRMKLYWANRAKRTRERVTT